MAATPKTDADPNDPMTVSIPADHVLGSMAPHDDPTLVEVHVDHGAPVIPDPPTLTSLTPSSIVVDTPTDVVVAGTGFRGGSKVVVDDVEQLTTYVSSSELGYVAEADSEGSQDVWVADPAFGQASAKKQMTVTATARSKK